VQVLWAFIWETYFHFEDQIAFIWSDSRGVKICKHVPEEVQDAARAAIDGPPEKKLKTVAGSSNNEVTNAISASAQEQNNEVMAQQGDALSLEELEYWIASFAVEEIDRKNFCIDDYRKNHA